MSGPGKMPSDVVELIRRAKRELPGEFVAYPLDSGLSIEEFRRRLIKRLKSKKAAVGLSLGEKMSKSMSREHFGITYWRSEEEWYYIDYSRDRYVLTDKAPEAARRSFEEWKKVNKIKWEEP